MTYCMDAALLVHVGFGVFAVAAGLAFYSKYQRGEKEKMQLAYSAQKDADVQELINQVQSLEKSNQNYAYKLNSIRKNYDVDLEDEELPAGPIDQILPTAVGAMADRLPPSIKPFFSDPEVIKSVVQIAVKNPDLVTKALSLFKPADNAASPKPSQYAL